MIFIFGINESNKNDMTSIYVLLDKSGSMETRTAEVISGFNEFIDTHKKLDDCRVSFYTFNDSMSVVMEDHDIHDVNCLTRENYEPGGMTALYDAMGAVLHKIPVGSTGGRKEIFIVLTDGEENSSHIFQREAIRFMIGERKCLEVIFMGSNQDAVLNGTGVGGKARTCLQYRDNNLRGAIRATSNAVYRYSSGETQGVEFTDKEREVSMGAQCA